MSRRRLVVLLLTVYAALDFANPLMPGAVTFEADDTVAGVHAPSPRLPQPEAVPVPERLCVSQAPEGSPRPMPAAPVGSLVAAPRRALDPHARSGDEGADGDH
jgi:hypothetical protein